MHLSSPLPKMWVEEKMIFPIYHIGQDLMYHKYSWLVLTESLFWKFRTINGGDWQSENGVL